MKNILDELLLSIEANQLADEAYTHYSKLISDGVLSKPTNDRELFRRGVLYALAGITTAMEREYEVEKRAREN